MYCLSQEEKSVCTDETLTLTVLAGEQRYNERVEAAKRKVLPAEMLR